MRNCKVAYLVTHPIQYQAPLLRRIAAEPDIHLKVFFASDVSLRSFVDPGFNRPIRWDVPLLEGYEYEFLPAFAGKRQISFYQPMNYGLSARLKAAHFDALWVHGYMRWHHWTAMVTARRLGMKVLVRDEATLLSSMRSALKRSLKRAFFACLRRIADRFLAIGSLNASYYRQYDVPDARIFMMPYAVDNHFFQTRAGQCAKARGALRASLELDPSRPVILYAGKLSERKRPDDLLKAYIQLSADGRTEPHPYLIFVGDGALRGALEIRASATGWSSIRFAGFRNQTELPAFYDLAEVFVLPSALEPWGLVVNEVMNAGCAVIASDRTGCSPDLIRDGENGFVFKTGDISDLCRTLREVLTSRVRCADMGRRSLEIINRWSFEEDVQGLRAALGL
ncbi:MAG: glycosyltransferase family 4 protein [Candidatus Binataceae bacterium]|nr:glycosyltransferase family 4 protein [Candidatus Binataceae bacterium]